MRVSYAEVAGNFVTFPSFNTASPLCAMSFKTSGVIQSSRLALTFCSQRLRCQEKLLRDQCGERARGLLFSGRLSPWPICRLSGAMTTFSPNFQEGQ